MIRAAYGLAALAILGVSSASAADLPRAMPVKAPVMAPVYNWSGFYVGAHVGYGWDPATAVVTPAGLLAALGLDNQGATPPFSLRVAPDGWNGGIQFGYNWQVGTWVFGLEADASFTNMKETASGGFLLDTDDAPAPAGGDDVIVTGVARLSQKIDAFGTVRGRVGYAANTLLLYVTGGLAWSHVETTLSIGNIGLSGGGAINFTPAQFTYSASDKRTEWGYAIGGGAEWAFAPNWSLRGEYLFLGFPNGGSNLSIPGAASTSSDIQMHVARLAVNFKFGP
jgi:outer membrane immunogenic protein